MSEKKHSGGRPTKLTPDIVERLTEAIRNGNYYESACAAAGISYQTFQNWKERGRNAKSGKYLEFLEAVERAEGEAEAKVIAMWQSHMPESWQACRDFLERRYQGRWGKNDRLKADLKHSGEQKIRFEIVRSDHKDDSNGEE